MKRAALLVALFISACGSSPPPPAPAPAPSAQPVASASASASPGGEGEMAHHGPAPRPPPAGQTVTVAFDGRSVDVDVAKVANGAPNAPILSVWKQAFPSEDTATLQFDLVGSDGFRPGLRPACSQLLTAKQLDAIKIDAASHDVVWSDAMKMPRCYNVKAVSRLEAKK